MFQFPACARLNVVHSLQLCGFPHSDIAGSIPVCRSPALFAAYHVLLRFWKPRHPPFALLLFLVLLSESTLRLSLVSSFFTRFTLGRSLRSRTSGATGFHGLTGGVYKARERIHRAMADARLLANPASWSRVADSNPN